MILTSLFATAALGLIIGSFLNVVIYRLPREMSISRPRWSFCPTCRTSIRWHDNIPVLGWLALRGRCRACRAPISMQYPLIELLTGLVFVAVFDAVVIARLVSNAGNAISAGIMVAAFCALFASMLANAVIDLEHYLIDVSLTYFAMIVGVAANAAAAVTGPVPVQPNWRLGVAATAAGAVWLLVARWAHRGRGETFDHVETGTEIRTDAASTGVGVSEAAGQHQAAPLQAPPHWPAAAAAIIALATAFSTLVTMVAVAPPAHASASAFAGRAIGVLSVLLFVLVLCAMQPRQADAEMITMLDDERPRARRTAVRELLYLSPSILVAAGVIAAWPMLGGGHVPPVRTWDWRLLSGLSDGMIGLMGSAALGWTVRIFFTMLFGKEAYGAGDIFLMAAIGAVGGFWVCLIAFFAACFLALVGVLAAMFRKNCRAIPFGPWLVLGTLVAIWIRPHVQSIVEPAAMTIWNTMTTR